MNNDSRNIDKLFRDGLTGFRSQRPVHAWESLNDGLNGLTRIKMMRTVRWLAASILLLIAFGAGYFYANYSAGNKKLTTDQTKQISTPVQDKPVVSSQTTGSGEVKQNSSNRIEVKEETKTVPSDNQQQFIANNKKEIIEPESGNEVPAETTEESGQKFTINKLQPLRITAIENKISLAENFRLINEVTTMPANILKYSDLIAGDFENDIIPQTANALKWTIGIQMAPTYSYRDINETYGNPGTGSSDPVADLNRVEDPMHSFAGRVDVAYAFSKKWEVQSGLCYTRIGQVNNDGLEFKQDNSQFLLVGIRTSTGNIDLAYENIPPNVKKISSPKDSTGAGLPTDVKVIQKMDLFEIPLGLRYKILNKKFSINLSGGLSPAYIVRNETYMEYQQDRFNIGSSGNLNSMIINSTFGLGIGYNITKQFSLRFEPTFKYALNPINKDSNINYHPYYLSWFTGINYNF